jgi:hypothetical protein
MISPVLYFIYRPDDLRQQLFVTTQHNLIQKSLSASFVNRLEYRTDSRLSSLMLFHPAIAFRASTIAQAGISQMPATFSTIVGSLVDAFVTPSTYHGFSPELKVQDGSVSFYSMAT